MRIYLDVDGVFGDIHLQLARALGLTHSEMMSQCQGSKGDYNMPCLPHIHDGNIWTHMGPQLGDTFWATLPDLPWFQQLWALVMEYDEDPVFLTSTAGWPNAASGRIRWMHDKFGERYDRFILTSLKDELAGPNCVLIDDFEDNVKAFRNRGGHAILLPRRWNSGDEGELIDYRPSIIHVIEHVRAELQVIADRMGRGSP